MKHSSYFEGKVQSLSLSETEGAATVGVIEPGTYEFSTSSIEHMTVIAGQLRARLPGGEWLDYAAGKGFTVPSGVKFQVEAKADTAYICRYR